MSISVVCQGCGESYQLSERFAGQQLKCQVCQQPVYVPAVFSGGTPAPDAERSRTHRPSFASGAYEQPAVVPIAPSKQTVAMDCRRCARRYRIPAELAGTAMPCRLCGDPLVAARPRPPPPPPPPP
ncbi:MAG: hypothetical protein WD847_10410, partial [Pirellulales bacterium]